METFLLVLRTEAVISDCMLEDFHCPSGFWKCNNGRCISDRAVCDGNLHCVDESDEENCADWSCVEGFINCADQKECVEVRHWEISWWPTNEFQKTGFSFRTKCLISRCFELIVLFFCQKAGVFCDFFS